MKKIILLAIVLMFAFSGVVFAAELLIKYPLASTYEVGDVVVVAEDGYAWGLAEGPPNFVLIKIPGAPIEEVTQYLQTLYDSGDWSDPDNHPQILKKRRFKADEVKIPGPVKAALRKDGEFTATVEQWNTFITDKEGQL